MKNQGKIYAVDKYPTRLGLVKNSYERLGITIVETIAADGAEYQGEPVDKIIVDVPCSGFGVLSKKPDIKHKREFKDMMMLQQNQKMLLENAATLLKPNGALVYSTCTIEPEENFNVIREFLVAHPEFEIDNASKYISAILVSPDGYVETFPHKHKIDGSFSIRLIKK